MNPNTKSFALGFLGGLVAMFTIMMVWNLSSEQVQQQDCLNITETNQTPEKTFLDKIWEKPMENPFKKIEPPDITKFANKVFTISVILFFAFYIFFSVNTQSR